MPTEVCSPVSRSGSKVGSGQPMSPGARCMPGADDRKDSVQPQRAEPEPPLRETAKVVGPED
jgi:hypothetical protein